MQLLWRISLTLMIFFKITSSKYDIFTYNQVINCLRNIHQIWHSDAINSTFLFCISISYYFEIKVKIDWFRVEGSTDVERNIILHQVFIFVKMRSKCSKKKQNLKGQMSEKHLIELKQLFLFSMQKSNHFCCFSNILLCTLDIDDCPHRYFLQKSIFMKHRMNSHKMSFLQCPRPYWMFSFELEYYSII